jgi:hypothetical protein
MIHSTLCCILIVFFAWLLLHALIYSKSDEGRIIEGLEPSSPPPPTTPPTPPTPQITTTTSESATPSQVQIDENAAQIEVLKKQVDSLTITANQLNTMMTLNEAGIANNTSLIQNVMKAQNDTTAKLDSMKKAQ